MGVGSWALGVGNWKSLLLSGATYSATLLAHSWLRWTVIATGLIAVLGGVIGVVRRGQWTPADDRAGMWFIVTFDLQVLIGLSMYFFPQPDHDRRAASSAR